MKRDTLLTAIFAQVTNNPEHPFTAALMPSSGKIEDIRFFTGEGVQAGPYPSAVCMIVSDVSTGAFEDQPREIEWQINCFSKKYTEANNLADWCKDLFDGQYMTAGGCQYTATHNISTGVMRSDDKEPWQVSITFNSLL